MYYSDNTFTLYNLTFPVKSAFEIITVYKHAQTMHRTS